MHEIFGVDFAQTDSRASSTTQLFYRLIAIELKLQKVREWKSEVSCDVQVL